MYSRISAAEVSCLQGLSVSRCACLWPMNRQKHNEDDDGDESVERAHDENQESAFTPPHLKKPRTADDDALYDGRTEPPWWMCTSS